MRKTTIIAAALAAALAGQAHARDMALVWLNDRSGFSGVTDATVAALRQAYAEAGFEATVLRNQSTDALVRELDRLASGIASADRVVVQLVGALLPMRYDSYILPPGAATDRRYARAGTTPGISLIHDLLSEKAGQAMLLVGTSDMATARTVIRQIPARSGALVVAGPYETLDDLVLDGFLAGTASLSGRGLLSNTVALPAQAVPAGPAAGATSSTAAAEIAAWDRVTATNTHQAYRDYIASHPAGIFTEDARRRLAALGPEVSPEEAVEKAMNLTRTERRAVQENLTLLGFSTRGVDGIFGPGTRSAIETWQASERFRRTGFLDPLQLRTLESSAARKRAEIEAQQQAERAARERADGEFWQATGATGREEDLRAYLGRYPDGIYAASAREQLAAIDRAAAEAAAREAGSEAAQVEERMGLDARTRRIIEQRLASLKLDPGPVDGTFDAQTRAAIRTFQEQQGMEVTGYLTNQVVGRMITSLFR